LSLQDTGDLEIVVSVSETLVARRQAVAQVSLVARFDALPDRTFDLYIKEFATEADSRTLSFAYVLGISDKNIGNILPGMSAIVTATRFRESASGPMVIPLSAVVAGIDDAPSVWKVDASNSVKKHPVTVGRLVEADQVEINSGITPGDVIVVVGSASLTEGMQVNPVNEVKF
jgi:RND family efflux transporter MFP subunit